MLYAVGKNLMQFRQGKAINSLYYFFFFLAKLTSPQQSVIVASLVWSATFCNAFS